MSNHLIWSFGEEVYLVFDHLAQDWCGQFRTLDEAEACADQLEHEFSEATEECQQTSEDYRQSTFNASYN
jgi:hypothetical protein